MGVFHASTTSTQSTVDSDAKHEIEAIAEKYDFDGEHGYVNVVVSRSDDDGDAEISIHGDAEFAPTKPLYDEDGEYVDEERGHTREFLERIAPFLNEQLVVETIGHKRYDYPFLAGMWSVWPDGTTRYDHFDHYPPKPASDTEELPLSVECTAEVVRIETADDREVAMWTRDELAENPEAFSAAFEAVQQARDAPAELLERHREHLDAQTS